MKIKTLALRIKTGPENDAFIQKDKKPHVKTLRYNSVTVLFADIQGFTKIVERLNPEMLVDQLDDFFVRFDTIVEHYGIEKIKTIGDAYMAASGLPERNSSHAIEMVMAALEIQAYMKHLREEKTLHHEDFWEVRIGIHTGPVIAGRVGRKKTTFDIWGDTVNTASRMESSGSAGEINITDSTYQMIKDFFVCEYRGQMPIKYKGAIDMYFVKGILPELSVNGSGLIPTHTFFTRLQHIRFIHLEEAVLNRLSLELPTNIKYHNVRHTIDVLTQVEILARNEKVSEEDLLLLKTAALMHDTGFLTNYNNHEYHSTIIASEVLNNFGYSSEQTKNVNQLINATRPQHHPTTLLERIIKDADLDHLGRADFFNLSELLFNEQKLFNPLIKKDEWLLNQLIFLSNHKYYTPTAIKMRQYAKNIHLKTIRQMVNCKN
jgi:class 3 adenylate cyclase/HD superfamily phosphodiesterase